MVMISECRDTFSIDVFSPERAHNESDQVKAKKALSGSWDQKCLKKGLHNANES